MPSLRHSARSGWFWPRHSKLAVEGPLAIGLVIGIAYFVAARFSLALLTAPDGVAVFWPSAGIASGALIALGPVARRPVVLATMAATIAANLLGDRNLPATLTFALCNAAEALLAAGLLHHYASQPFNLDTMRRVLALFGAAAVAAGISGIGGTLGFVLFHSSAAPILTTWSNWFVSDGLGIVTVAPLVIGLIESRRQPPTRAELIEGLASLVALAAAAAIGFAAPTQYWVTILPPALLVPLLLWPTARCRPVFAAGAIAIVALTIVWTITFGIGRLGDTSIPLASRVLAAQGALLAIELGTLVLAAVFAEQRHYQAALKQSEARLREALTAGQVMAFEWEPHSKTSQRSANAQEILGFQPQDGLSATQFLAQVHADDRASLTACLRKVCPQNPSYAVRFRFRRPDNQQVWLEETATAEFNTAGHLLRIKGLARDITECKLAEETLQRNEQQLRELLGALPAAIYVTDAVGRLTYCNQGAIDLWGVSPQLGVDQWCDFARFYHADGTPMRRQECPTMIALTEGRAVRDCEAIMERRDGARIAIMPNPTPLRDAKGAVVGVVNMTVDISERRRAELALAERDLQLALAGKAARVGSFAYDTLTELIQVSQGYVAIHGLAEGTTQIARSHWRTGVHPEDLSRLDAQRDWVWRQRRREANTEYRVVLGGGETRWIEARSFTSYDHHGRPQRVVGVNIDITERKRAEEQQRVLVAELDHRVKNVLATVSAIISRTLDGRHLAVDFAAALEGRIRSMSSTHELLSQGRWRGIPLLELVQRELAPFATPDNTDIAGPEAMLGAEAAQIMAMVLHELVTNAAKYGALSNRSGRVSVRWRWRMNGAEHGRRLIIEWREIGGPLVAQHNQTGYGTSVIRELLPYELGGSVDLKFAADGVHCQLEIPPEWTGGFETTGLAAV